MLECVQLKQYGHIRFDLKGREQGRWSEVE